MCAPWCLASEEDKNAAFYRGLLLHPLPCPFLTVVFAARIWRADIVQLQIYRAHPASSLQHHPHREDVVEGAPAQRRGEEHRDLEGQEADQAS
jgi:hypothetical protein